MEKLKRFWIRGKIPSLKCIIFNHFMMGVGHCGFAFDVQAVLTVVDASNLRRNLYLISQILELDLPLVVGLKLMWPHPEGFLLMQRRFPTG